MFDVDDYNPTSPKSCAEFADFLSHDVLPDCMDIVEKFKCEGVSFAEAYAEYVEDMKDLIASLNDFASDVTVYEYDDIMNSNYSRKMRNDRKKCGNRKESVYKKSKSDRQHGKKRKLSRKQVKDIEWNDIWTCVENKHNHAVSVMHLCERKKTVNLRNNKKAEVMRQKEKEYKNNFDYLSVLAELKMIKEKMIALDQKIEEENEELSNFYYRCCADGDDIIIMDRTCINQLVRYRDKLSEERYNKLDELFMMEEGF